MRLNRLPPEDELVVDMISIDSSFDPYYPELYHLKKQRQSLSSHRIENDISNADNTRRTSPQVSGSKQENSVSASKSSVETQPYYYPLRNCVKCSVQGSNRSKKIIAEEKCLICLSDERSATIVHGETGHIACCLSCARILKARGDKVSSCLE